MSDQYRGPRYIGEMNVYRTYRVPLSERAWGWSGFAARGLALGAAGFLLAYMGWRMSKGG